MPRQYTPRISVTCEGCAAPFSVRPSQLKVGKGKFCGKPCANRALIQSAPDRFWPLVQKTDRCWLWMGWRDALGYGRFWMNGRSQFAHRVAWYLTYDAWPPLPLDHLCRVPSCVNVISHLEPVTSRVNSLRGQTVAAANAQKTHCPRGHPYDEVNTRRTGGRRFCRACRRAHEARYRTQAATR
jgi:hypothetical protein